MPGTTSIRPISRVSTPGTARPRLWQWLEELVDETLPDRPEGTRVTVVNDHAARALIDASEGAWTVVVGSRGLGGFRGLLLGSVSQQVVHHARCAVLVVPGPADDD